MLYVDGMFCLTDMPALNWSATPVLTKDPVAHTLIQGKRFLANDMWGLGATQTPNPKLPTPDRKP